MHYSNALFRTFQTGFKKRICNLIGCRRTSDFRQPMRLQICLFETCSEKRESCIVPCKNLTNLQKFFVFFSFYELVS